MPPRNQNGNQKGKLYIFEQIPYSFPHHPLNKERAKLFFTQVKRSTAFKKVQWLQPVAAKENELQLFHTKEYIDFVKRRSKEGAGFLDYGDTPAVKGIYDLATLVVGSTLKATRLVLAGKCEHAFNPIGGLHHAHRDAASGFCVFNDVGVAISWLLQQGLRRIAYIDIDAHHGDGVYYAFASDERVWIADVHEFAPPWFFPGTGSELERGTSKGEGTKINLCLAPGDNNNAFKNAFQKALSFIQKANPEFIIFQCGADCLANDPLTHLRCTPEVHTFATAQLHAFAHKACEGRIIALGGGGYNAENVAAAWLNVTKELLSD